MSISSLYTDTSASADYPATIRRELVKAVEDLKARLEDHNQWNQLDRESAKPDKPVVAEYVTIGYMVNSHKGHPLFLDGDSIAGLPVTIDGENPHSIRVFADEVWFVKEVEGIDEDDDLIWVDASYEEDLMEETTL